jgi:hypothetical protein
MQTVDKSGYNLFWSTYECQMRRTPNNVYFFNPAPMASGQLGRYVPKEQTNHISSIP